MSSDDFETLAPPEEEDQELVEDLSLSAFGRYIVNIVRYLKRFSPKMSRRRLAKASGVVPSTLTELIRHPEKRPASETVQALYLGIPTLVAEINQEIARQNETIARQNVERKRRGQPEQALRELVKLRKGWELELFVSAHVESADGFLFQAYFGGYPLPKRHLDEIDALILSLQETRDIVRRRSQPEN